MTQTATPAGGQAATPVATAATHYPKVPVQASRPDSAIGRVFVVTLLVILAAILVTLIATVVRVNRP